MKVTFVTLGIFNKVDKVEVTVMSDEVEEGRLFSVESLCRAPIFGSVKVSVLKVWV